MSSSIKEKLIKKANKEKIDLNSIYIEINNKYIPLNDWNNVKYENIKLFIKYQINGINKHPKKVSSILDNGFLKNKMRTNEEWRKLILKNNDNSKILTKESITGGDDVIKILCSRDHTWKTTVKNCLRATCNKCSKIIAQEKKKETLRLKRIEKLNNKLNETNSKFLYLTNKSSGDKQLSIDNLKGERKSTIHFNCGFCGNNCYKGFTNAIRKGPGFICKSCTQKEKTKTAKKNSIEKYGVEHPWMLKEKQEERKKIWEENGGGPWSKEAMEKREETNLKNRGVKYPGQCPEVKKKARETNIKRYGGPSPICSQKIKEKMEKTNIERYGCKVPSQNIIVKAKVKKTNIDRFGMWATQREEHKERIKKTNKERYGVEIASKSDIVKEKIKKTNNERYGGNSVMSDPKIREKCFKNMKDRKEYKFPSGRIEYVQGYEPQALDILLKKYDENDIVCSNSPTIYYSFNGKQHFHLTDIFIKSENKIIEVKSTWTFEKKEDKILIKQRESKNQGYKYEIWILTKKGEIIDILN